MSAKAKARARETAPLVFARPIVADRTVMSGHGVCRRVRGLGDWLVWVTIGGRCRVVHDRGSFETGPGEWVLIAPHVRQEYGLFDLSGEWACVWAVFDPRPHWAPWLAWPEEGRGTMRLRPPNGGASAASRRMLESCVSSFREAAPGGDWAMCHLERALLTLNACNPAARPGVEPRVEAAMQWMARRLSESIVLDDVASAAGLSVPHLIRLFRAHVGSTPMQFLERRRMERARQLLALTTRPIGDVAREVGFSDPGYFSTRFRRYAGISPRRFRRQSSGDPPRAG